MKALAAIIFCGMMAALVLHVWLHTGIASSNWGRFERSSKPGRYWASVGVIAIFVAIFVLAGFLG